MSFLLNLFYITIVYLFLLIQSMYTKDAQDNRIRIYHHNLYALYHYRYTAVSE